MAITKIQSESLNLADTYAFTGTVTGAGGVNTPYFEAKLTSRQTISSNVTTKVAFNSAVVDTDSCFDTTNNRFLPTTAGKYLILLQLTLEGGAVTTLEYDFAFILKNGSTICEAHLNTQSGGDIRTNTLNAHTILDMNGTSDYVEAYGKIVSSSTPSYEPGTYTRFIGFKLI